MIEWSISDGPKSLSENDIDQHRTFTVRFTDDTVAQIVILLTHVGTMFGGDTKSFSGSLTIGPHVHEVIGTYNVSTKTGHCHTTASL